MPGCVPVDVPAARFVARAEALWAAVEEDGTYSVVAPSVEAPADEFVLWKSKKVGAEDDCCWCSLLREPSLAIAGVSWADVLGRFKSRIPLVPPPASRCLEVPLFPVRLDVRDDATATVEQVVTALVEADDETWR